MSKKPFILLVMLLVVLTVVAKKAKSQQNSEWHGLTESEARSKLDAKLPDKIPSDKRSALADMVVGKMRDRGVIVDQAAVPDDASDLAEDTEPLTTS